MATINNQDLLAVQAYVTAKDDTQFSNLSESTLVLDLTHSNLKQRHIEIRFDKCTTISSVRDKIYQTTGTAPHHQHLQIIQSTTSPPLFDIPPGQENDRMLGYYSITNGITVHCIDTDPHSASRGGGYEDTSLVERYVMSDEDYNKRKGTLRDWGRVKKKQDPSFSLAKHAKEHRELMEAQRQAKLGLDLPKGFEFDQTGKVVRIEDDIKSEDDVSGIRPTSKADVEQKYGKDTVDGIEIDMRCQISPGNRRGSIAFVGIIPELGVGGHWVGVIFDEPVGKTDGTVSKNGKSHSYFTAPGPKYGGFLRGQNVTVGDFPERDIMDELEDDSEDEL